MTSSDEEKSYEDVGVAAPELYNWDDDTEKQYMNHEGEFSDLGLSTSDDEKQFPELKWSDEDEKEYLNSEWDASDEEKFKGSDNYYKDPWTEPEYDTVPQESATYDKLEQIRDAVYQADKWTDVETPIFDLCGCALDDGSAKLPWTNEEQEAYDAWINDGADLSRMSDKIREMYLDSSETDTKTEMQATVNVINDLKQKDAERQEELQKENQTQNTDKGSDVIQNMIKTKPRHSTPPKAAPLIR